jgi:hypothetical protein
MRLLATFLLLAGLCFAQTPPAPLPPDFFAAGANFNQQLTPPISGWALYAKPATENNYIFSFADVTSKTLKPFTVSITLMPGVARRLGRYAGVDLFIAGNVGGAFGGDNAGLAYSGAGAGVFRVYKDWCGVVPVRVLKTTIGDLQLVIGLGIGRRRT